MAEHMTEVEMILFVNKFTYKPNWNFVAIRYPAMSGIHVEASYTAQDANGVHEGEIRIHASILLFDYRTPDELKQDMVGFIKKTELHEVDEWLRFDGERLNDPHIRPAFTRPTARQPEHFIDAFKKRLEKEKAP